MRYHFLPPGHPETHGGRQTSEQSPLLCHQTVRERKRDKRWKRPSCLTERGRGISGLKRSVISRPHTSVPQGLVGKSQRKDMKTCYCEGLMALSLENLLSWWHPRSTPYIHVPYTKLKAGRTRPLPGKKGQVCKWREEQSSKEVVSYSAEILKNQETRGWPCTRAFFHSRP